MAVRSALCVGERLDSSLGQGLLDLKHISIRVPWHDDHWRGTVCKDPSANNSCLRLNRIAGQRDDEAETAVAGVSIDRLDEPRWPACVSERGTFMSPFPVSRTIVHPYSDWGSHHRHFKPTFFRQPPYSAAAIPFRWMHRKYAWDIAREQGLDARSDREPDRPAYLANTRWVQNHENQKALLEGFRRRILPERSLCLFYAKQTPLSDDNRRVLLGVGRVLNVREPVEYDYKETRQTRSYIWDLAVQHSIRLGFADGFLLPYHEILEYAEKHAAVDPAEVVAFAPEDRTPEFSYVAEHVTNDGAIQALLECAASMEKIARFLPGPWRTVLKWIDARLAELWTTRGPSPGLGAALCAFGVELGVFVAREISRTIGENEDPWPLVDSIFRDPTQHLSRALAPQIGRTLQAAWKALASERRSLLQLLSRFELTPDQARRLYVQEERQRAGVPLEDDDLLKNPYLIYESTKLTSNAISIWTVDRGVFPDATVRQRHPLPPPSFVDTGTDERRMRALVAHILEKASERGDTLLPQKDVILKIRDLALSPSCDATRDILAVAEHHFKGAVEAVELATGDRAYQLERLSRVGSRIRQVVERRIRARRHHISADWRSLLDAHFGSTADTEEEERARQEKASALQEIADSRFSVLIGPAGTGKTTLLALLSEQEEVARGGVLLLAPTGKARVKMEQASRKVRYTAYTVAQFLKDRNRYDPETRRYQLSDTPPQEIGRTVIIDEASMMTEEMLAAVFESLKNVDRWILVGDPSQLPPIGPGRPFVDIVTLLTPQDVNARFPRVAAGYAELTVRRRQAGGDREDLQLAEWFSGRPMNPGDDEVFQTAVRSDGSRFVEFLTWETPEQLRGLLLGTLTRELQLAADDDIEGFERSIGAAGDMTSEPSRSNTDETDYAAQPRNFALGAAMKAESWQILSPVRALTHGVFELNRFVHKRFRRRALENARKRRARMIPTPLGNEEIVYGDKVINVVNHYRDRYEDYQRRDGYLANGEVGILVGQFRTPSMSSPPDTIRAEFASQPGSLYDFTDKDFGEESSPPLELAYALTVHKAQGSEFGRVILVLPNPCRLLSRELMYTALTRQREKVTALCQGDPIALKAYASDAHSEIARRVTNLFQKPRLVEVRGRILEGGLIHLTPKGEPVRSKSEVIIAALLESNGVPYEVEPELTLGGVTKWADFRIRDDDAGVDYYWEHCGMLGDPEYRARHERKMSWYRQHGILPHQEGGGTAGTLIVTYDDAKGGISAPEIESIIKHVILRR